MIRICLPLLVILAACQTTPSQASRDCGAAALDARSGASLAELGLADHPGPVRIIRPWETVRPDVVPERLNVVLRRGDVLDGAYCG